MESIVEDSKILIVEDNPDLLAAYKRIIGRAGYRVYEATTGADALRMCSEVMPDLVLLDAVLPDADGADICRRIKAGQEFRTIFVVMVSGQKNSPEYQALFLEQGADGFMQKPIDQKVLLANIRAILRLKKAEKDLEASKDEYRELAERLQATNLRLEEYNRLKAEFIANMSHELRTPLTAIIGFAQLAQMKTPGAALPPDCAVAFERILLNGRHLLTLIDEVLDIAKIEAGRMKLHPDHFEVADLAQDAFNELQSLAIQKGLDYRLHVSEHLPFAFTDPVRVRQVMINLLSNAIKFTEKGAVEVSLMPYGERQFRFVVRDTGIGIDDAAIKFIFERFRQADGAMTRVAGGTGLGLSIVKQIVALLGGEIDVTSEPGKGSKFTVTLPLSLSDERQAAERARTDKEAGRIKSEENAGDLAAQLSSVTQSDGGRASEAVKPLVLIIEDDPDMADLLSQTVAKAGYRTLTADAGKPGLQIAREKEVAAILLDVMMPGMDGWKVLQALKSDNRTAQIPVIVCSIVDNRPLGYRLGASHYFVKPVEPRQLTAVLQDIVPNDIHKSDNYVLVVDDEHGIRELLASALRKAGFNVRAAASGEIALKMLSSHVPQAVLSDLMMPGGMSGFELIARVRSNPQTENLPIIVITGKDMTPDDKLFISNEIADVIRKGDLMMSDLETRLRQTLEEIGVKPNEWQKY
ncbi:MAG TPA: response regulator [Pyrinomonadaceae bacterium]|jgi:signal transduction histidine kinase